MTAAHLTPKQKQLLDYLRDYTREHGYAPSQREMADRFGFRSLGTVQNYLVRLEREGLIRRAWNAKRAIEVVAEEETSGPVPELPLLGYVAAGRPIEAVLDNETLEVPPALAQGRGDFVLQVKGESMVDDGIRDGDYIVIRKQATASNGQTVVALVDGEATVKRYFRRGERVELRPANETMESLWLEGQQEFRIAGVVVALLRYW